MSKLFSDRYVETALWTEYAEVGDRPLAAEARRKMVADCDRFQRENKALLRRAAARGEDDAKAGGDFWLSRNGYGAGFRDRGLGDLEVGDAGFSTHGLGEVGDMLHAAAKKFGSCDLYVGDDDEVHVA